jgi:hypothetical protein
MRGLQGRDEALRDALSDEPDWADELYVVTIPSHSYEPN